MADPNNQPPDRRRRIGRRRQAPLPPGPAIQFVVANHPDHFRQTQTMRNVRSHVMYRHREQEGSSASESNMSREGSSTPFLSMTAPPSPARVPSDGASEDNSHLSFEPTHARGTSWDGGPSNFITTTTSTDPLRTLISQIASALTAIPASNVPPGYEDTYETPFQAPSSSGNDSLDVLRSEYIERTNFFVHDLPWMQRLCSNPLLFLCHVGVACVYQDQAEGHIIDTEYTIRTRAGVYSMMQHNPQSEDVHVLAVCHFLVWELGNLDEQSLDIHWEELVRIFTARGWSTIGDGMHLNFARLIMLTFQVMRGQRAQDLNFGTSPNNISLEAGPVSGVTSQISAVFGDLTQLYSHCTVQTLDVLRDIDELIQVVLSQSGQEIVGGTTHLQRASEDGQLHQIYSRLLFRPSTEDDAAPDRIYECCRLAALIFCSALIQDTSLAVAASSLYASNTPFPETQSATLLSSLHSAIDQTNVRGCWGELRVLFLWVTLIGASASWAPHMYMPMDDTMIPLTWTRKCFALYALRAAVSCVPEDADATIRSLQVMLQIRGFIDRNARL
ncbi:hypothetical protein ACN47E_004259 [Coniothyrium glycines]